MGTVYPKGGKLYLGYRTAAGKWTYAATGFPVGQEAKAKKLLEKIESRVAATSTIAAPAEGPLTVERYARHWLIERTALGIADVENEESRLEHHIYAALGELKLNEVRPRHIIDLIRKLRIAGKLAPKSIYNVYSVLKALFRDAHMADLIDTSPCVLTKYQLGENTDKDPEWRATAVYTRDELEMLIADPRLPEDRQVLYALEGLAALRHGEAAGLRWRHYDPTLSPLGGLTIATSYDKGRTKTKRSRRVPVHPTLAAMLAEWKLGGWPKMMGRPPGPDDLVVPMPKSARIALGTMRSKNESYKRLRRDLRLLGLRARRGHDLRRTMISLTRMDGARPDLLQVCTHNPKKGAGTIDLYTTYEWRSLCEEVGKLRIERRPRGQIIDLPQRIAVAGNQEVTDILTTVLTTDDGKLSNLLTLIGGGAGSRTRAKLLEKLSNHGPFSLFRPLSSQSTQPP